MGLDVALGILILIAAIRGWIQGFVYQAVRIAGLIACVYLAGPVRDQAKPYLLPYLPAIQPNLVDRLFWWVSAAFTYVLLVGLATLVIKMTHRPEIPGIPQASRNDQFAGFLLGAAKGTLIAAFLTAGIQKYALSQIATIAWANEQVQSSWALRWNQDFQPAAKVWASVPVQHFVGHIQRMGLQDPAEAPLSHRDPKAGEQPAVQTASRALESEVPGPPQPAAKNASSPQPPASAPAPKVPVIDSEVAKAVEESKSLLDAAAKPSN